MPEMHKDAYDGYDPQEHWCATSDGTLASRNLNFILSLRDPGSTYVALFLRMRDVLVGLTNQPQILNTTNLWPLPKSLVVDCDIFYVFEYRHELVSLLPVAWCRS